MFNIHILVLYLFNLINISYLMNIIIDNIIKINYRLCNTLNVEYYKKNPKGKTLLRLYGQEGKMPL